MKKCVALFYILFMISCCINPTSSNTTMKKNDYFKMNRKGVEFASAIEWQDTSKLKRLLKKGVNINSYGKDSISYLIWALINERPQSFLFLLEHGANPNQVLNGNNTAMTFAAVQESPYYLRELLEHGGNPNQLCPEGGISYTMLEECFHKGLYKNMELLLQSGANPNACDPQTGEPPLYKTIFSSEDKAIQLLLQYNANPFIVDSIGEDLFDKLIANESFPGQSEYATYLDSLLIELANTKHKAPKYTTLWSAKDADRVSLLITNGVDINGVNSNGDNALTCYSMRNGKIAIVEILIKYGIKINNQNIQNETALDILTKYQSNLADGEEPYDKVIELLKRHGAKTRWELAK